MRVTLAYGSAGLPLQLPDDGRVRVLRKQDAPQLPEPEQAVRRALGAPTGGAPLAALAAGRRSAVVVISDITRPVPNTLLLPPLLATLEEAGVPRAGITILIATGMHRPNLGEELLALVGEDIARDYRVVNHRSREAADLVDLGRTSAGIPILVNRHYLQAELKVLTGFIEPHLWAGYSGGTKAVLPGVCGLETMKHMHGYRMVEDPRTHYGSVADNPFRKACWEVAQMAGADFLLNVTLSEEKRLTGVFAGHPLEAWLAGVAFLEQSVVARLPEPVDLAVTCCGGDPLDRTLYQTIKGMSGAAPILKPDGRMIVASACTEGAGSDEFKSLLDESASPFEGLARMREPGFFRADQWAAQEIFALREKHRIGLRTDGLPPEQIAAWHLDPVADLQAEVDAALERGESVAVVPEGPYVIAQVG